MTLWPGALPTTHQPHHLHPFPISLCLFLLHHILQAPSSSIGNDSVAVPSLGFVRSIPSASLLSTQEYRSLLIVDAVLGGHARVNRQYEASGARGVLQRQAGTADAAGGG